MVRFCLFIFAIAWSSLLLAQKNDHIQGETIDDLHQTYQHLSDAKDQKDTQSIFDYSFELLTHYSALSNWDSIYYYNTVVAENALPLRLYDKHLASLINNISMDQMFRRKADTFVERYTYLQSFLKNENVSVMYKAEIANMLAGRYYRIGNIDSTLHYQEMAVKFADIKDDHQKRRIIGRIQLAAYYREFGRSSDALYYLVEVESELENSLLPAMQKIYFYNTITQALVDINDLDRATEYLIKLRDHIEDNGYQSMYYKYHHLNAKLKSKQGNSKESINAYRKSLELANVGKAKEIVNSLWIGLAKEYCKNGELDNLQMVIDSLSLYKSELNDRMQLSYYGLLFRREIAEEDFSSAKKYLGIINENYNHVMVARASVALMNNDFYDKIGDDKNAYLYFKKYTRLKDSLILVQNAAQAKSLETRYNRDKQDTEIELLSTRSNAQDKAIAVRNRTILLGSIMLTILAILLIGLYRLFRKNQESQLLLAQQNNEITKALEQNKILIKEIHHRVKNNLQVVSSLLSLQERKVDDQATKEALKSSQTRVQTMSLIHKSLYQKDDVRSIDIKTYFKQLAENLVNSFAIHPVDLQLDIDEMNIDIDFLVPLGLVANELICNALKHGIYDMDDGVLSVALKSENDKIILSVEDNGGKLGAGNLVLKEGSLGTKLINAFANNLQGTLSVIGGETTYISLAIDKDNIIFSDL